MAKHLLTDRCLTAMKNLYKKIVLWLISTKLWSWILLDVIPYIRFSNQPTKIRGRVYNEGYKLLQLGDIIVSRDNKKLTTWLITGKSGWTHASLCVGKKEWPRTDKVEVLEMDRKGMVQSDFFDICHEADRVAIYRCRDFTPEYIQKVINKCWTFMPVPYDVTFSMGVEALACSEMVYWADFDHIIQCDLTDDAHVGKPFISPNGLAAAKNVEKIWDSDIIYFKALP